MGSCESKNKSMYSSKTEKNLDNKNNFYSRGPSIHNGSVLGLASASSCLLSCSDDKSISILRQNKESQMWEKQASLIGHDKAVNRVAIRSTEHGNIVWSASRDLSIRQVS